MDDTSLLPSLRLAPRTMRRATRLDALRLTGLIFALGVLVLGALAAMRALPHTLPAGTSWADGAATRAFEAHYDAVFPVKTLGVNLWGAIQYRVFGEGRPGVIVGENGWLYTREEFAAPADAEARIEARLDEIARVQAQLSARGIGLTVALLPAKARVYPEHLPAQRPAPVHRELHARAHAALAQRRIAAPDLLTGLLACKRVAPVFLRTDTHWTPQGAACAARALTIGVPPNEPLSAFVTTPGERMLVHGDLLQFLPLAPHFASWLPAADRVRLQYTQAADTGSEALLAEAPAPRVLLVGTSYSADARWNFDGALREALAADVLNLAEPGRGPFAPMQALLGQLDTLPAPPRHVIWEIPERYLPASDRAPAATRDAAH